MYIESVNSGMTAIKISKPLRRNSVDQSQNKYSKVKEVRHKGVNVMAFSVMKL